MTPIHVIDCAFDTYDTIFKIIRTKSSIKNFDKFTNKFNIN